MDDATLDREISYWLSESFGWPCEAGRNRGPRRMCRCSACQIHTSLESMAAAARVQDWTTAHRLILRASRIEGRLDPLRDEIEERAFAPYEEVTVMAEGSGPVRIVERAQDPEVMYECGKTYREHKEICADVIRRECEFDVIEPIHSDELEVHLGQGTCPGCKSTFCWPLPGHRERADGEDEAALADGAKVAAAAARLPWDHPDARPRGRVTWK